MFAEFFFSALQQIKLDASAHQAEETYALNIEIDNRGYFKIEKTNVEMFCEVEIEDLICIWGYDFDFLLENIMSRNW